MAIAQTALDYQIKQGSTDSIPVIVVAAGNSSRMKGINKQLLELCSIPVIIRTLMAFERCDRISDIILVVRADDVFGLQMLCEQYKITKLSDIVCGGNSRQESVLKGLARVGEEQERVLIHDGARPLVDNRTICAVADALKINSAVIPVVNVKDTVKQIDEDGFVVKTLPREELVLVQTPQGVCVDDYKKALDSAAEKLSQFTDDASLMEAAGFKVATVEGDFRNIKITTRADIALAECYLKEESE